MPDGWVEDAIAADVAVGMPQEMVVSKFGLAGPKALARILEKPRVSGMVQGYRRYTLDAGAIMGNKLDLRGIELLDDLFYEAKNPKNPNRDRICMWWIDKVRPDVKRVEIEEDHRVQVDIDVVGRLSEVVEKFGELIASRTPVFELGDGDPHLHQGQEFIKEREEDLARLGTGGQDSG